MKTFEMAKQMSGYGPPTPVSIFQWVSEFETVLELYRRFSPEDVLEVGTYHGGTLYHWLQNARPGANVVSVDSYAVGVDNRALYPDWVPENVDLRVVVGDSRAPETIEAVRKRSPFDWLFIDAGHYYGEVKADWENYSPMVRSPGAVVLHDILPPSYLHPEIEVARLWEELRKTERTLDIVQDREAAWGGIGVVLV